MIKINWEEVIQMCKQLAQHLKGKNITGVPRGGTIVAAILSYHGCILRDAEVNPRIDYVVDDIADTGSTLESRKFGYVRTAALIVRKGCDPMPDCFIKLEPTEEYILMPWEDEEEVKEQIARGTFRSTPDAKSS